MVQQLDRFESTSMLQVDLMNIGSSMATREINGAKRPSGLVNKVIHLESLLKVSCAR